MFSVVNLVADRIPEKNITCTVFWGPQFAGLQVLALILQMNIHVGYKEERLNHLRIYFFRQCLTINTYLNPLITI